MVVGLSSASPTLRIVQWRKRARAEPASALGLPEVNADRPFFIVEIAVFALFPVFAAIMVRGIGL